MRLFGRAALVSPLFDWYGFGRRDGPFTPDVSTQSLPAIGATPLRRFTEWLVARSTDRRLHARPAVRTGVVLAVHGGGCHWIAT